LADIGWLKAGAGCEALSTKEFAMKKLAALIAVAFTLAVPLHGCNTWRAAGQDVQKAGEKMEDSSKKRQ
jgi:predicted small secreted protein